MKKARMNSSHFRFILCNLKIFGEIVTTNDKTQLLTYLNFCNQIYNHPSTIVLLTPINYSLRN